MFCVSLSLMIVVLGNYCLEFKEKKKKETTKKKRQSKIFPSIPVGFGLFIYTHTHTHIYIYSHTFTLTHTHSLMQVIAHRGGKKN